MTNMIKVIRWTLIIIICVLSSFWAYVSFILIIGSGFIMGDIDHTEAERQVADVQATILSILGFVSLRRQRAVVDPHFVDAPLEVLRHRRPPMRNSFSAVLTSPIAPDDAAACTSCPSAYVFPLTPS